MGIAAIFRPLVTVLSARVFEQRSSFQSIYKVNIFLLKNEKVLLCLNTVLTMYVLYSNSSAQHNSYTYN